MMFGNLFSFLNTNGAGLAVILTFAAAVYKFWQFVNIKREEQKQKQFENYHSLIKNLSQSDTPGEHVKLDRQVAAVYELRSFPKYKEVTKRILRGWQAASKEQRQQYKVLYDEIDLTVKYLNESRLERILSRKDSY